MDTYTYSELLNQSKELKIENELIKIINAVTNNQNEGVLSYDELRAYVENLQKENEELKHPVKRRVKRKK